jgi:hypothetical protein
VPSIGLVALASLGQLALWAARHSTSTYVALRCGANACADRYHEAWVVFWACAAPAPLAAAVLAAVARRGDRMRVRIVAWACFVVGFVAWSTYGLWVTSSDDLSKVGARPSPVRQPTMSASVASAVAVNAATPTTRGSRTRSAARATLTGER